MTADSFDRLRALAERALSDPTTVEDSFDRLLEGCEDLAEERTQPELRETVASAIEAVVRVEATVLRGDSKRLFDVVEKQQSELDSSRVTPTSQSASLLVESQSSLMEALAVCILRTSEDPSTWANDIPHVFAETLTYADLTATALDTYDCCLSDDRVSPDMEALEQFWEAESETVVESLVDVHSTIAVGNPSTVVPYCDRVLGALEQVTAVEPVLELLIVLIGADPVGTRTLRPQLRQYKQSPTTLIRLGSTIALVQFPDVTTESLEDNWKEVIEAVLEGKNASTVVRFLSECERLPEIPERVVKETIQLLGDQQRSYNHAELLISVFKQSPAKVVNNTDSLANLVEDGDRLSSVSSLLILGVVSRSEPEVVADHLEVVAEQVRGQSSLERRHQNRMEAMRHSISRRADVPTGSVTPNVYDDQSVDRALGRATDREDGEIAIAEIALRILDRVVEAQPDRVADCLDDILVGLLSQNRQVQTRVLRLVLTLASSHADKLYTHRNRLIDFVDRQGDDTVSVSLSLFAKFVLFLMTRGLTRDVGHSPTDFDQVLTLLDGTAGDGDLTRLERCLSCIVVRSLLARYRMSTERYRRVAEEDTDAIDILYEFGSSVSEDEVKLGQGQVRQLIDVGLTGGRLTQNYICFMLSLIALNNTKHIIPYLNIIINWKQNNIRPINIFDKKSLEEKIENKPFDISSSVVIRVFNKAAEIVEATDTDYSGRLARLFSVLSLKKPAAVLPHADTVAQLADSADPDTAREALAALVRTSRRESLVVSQLVPTAVSQLSHPDPAVRETAAVLCSVLVDDAPEAFAGDLPRLVAALREASSDTTRLGLARTVAVVAERHPAAVVNVADHLCPLVNPPVLNKYKTRSVPLDAGVVGSLISENQAENARNVGKFVRRGLRAGLTAEELGDEWSKYALSTLLTGPESLSRLAAERLSDRSELRILKREEITVATDE